MNRLARCAAALAAAALSCAAQPQPFPSKPMNQIGFDVVASTPGEFAKFMQDEVMRWTRVVERGGIKPD